MRNLKNTELHVFLIQNFELREVGEVLCIGENLFMKKTNTGYSIRNVLDRTMLIRDKFLDDKEKLDEYCKRIIAFAKSTERDSEAIVERCRVLDLFKPKVFTVAKLQWVVFTGNDQIFVKWSEESGFRIRKRVHKIHGTTSFKNFPSF
jgi:hypothetical protein